MTDVTPVVSIRTFMAVTGPKSDICLVKTVGAVVMAIGVAFALAATRRAYSLEVMVLAVGSATYDKPTLIDVIHVHRRAIAPI